MRRRSAAAAAVALVAAATVHVAAQASGAEPPRPLRVMAVGDSITQGFPDSRLNVPGIGMVGSWRYWFWQNRAAAGCAAGLDMVGEFNTLFNTTQQLPNVPAATDQDHESRAGDKVDGYARSRIIYHQAVENAQPDVVLILLGTNDLFPSNQLGDSPETVRDQMVELIGQVRAHKPDVAVFLMGVQPRGLPADWAPRIPQTNLYYQGIADTLDLPGSPIFYVDGFYGFDQATDTFDHLHPNTQGQQKIAARFTAALADYCAAQNPATTTTVPASTTSTEPPCAATEG